MDHPRRGVSKPVVLASLLIVVLLLAALGYRFWFGGMSVAEAQKLVRLADAANANLENEKFRQGFEQAEANLMEIRKSLPDSPFVYRNLVVAKLLFFMENKDQLQDDQAYIDQTTQLVEQLIEKEPNSFEPYILAVRWRFQLTNDITETDIELLEQAIQHAGSSPIPYYEFFDRTAILDDSDVPGIVVRQQQYLAKAYELQPDNIKLSMLYLQQLSEAKSPDFDEVWKQFKKQLLPLVVSADLEAFETSQQEYVQKIDEAFYANNWPQVLLNVRRLSNLVKRGEVLKIDLARVQPYELEFLKFSLDEKIVAKAKSNAAKVKSVPVKFGESIELHSGASYTDVRAVDYDLDNIVEIAALAGKQFFVFEPSENGSWTIAYQVEFEKSYSSFLAADLDYDKRSVVPRKEGSDDSQGSGISNNYSDPDFVFYGSDGIGVFENLVDENGKRVLSKIEPGDLGKSKAITAAVLVDVDHDKDLDLVTAGSDGMKLFLSRGNLSFYDFSEHSVFPPNDKVVCSLDIVDLDRDIDIDVLVGFDGGGPGYLENLGHSQLRFRNLDESFDSTKDCQRIFATEMDGNPSWDLVGDSQAGLTLTTTTTSQSSVRQRSVSRVANVNQPILGLADFNNDGYPDSVCSDGNQSHIVLGQPGSLNGEPVAFGRPLKKLDVSDFDQDGKQDLVGITADGQSIQVWTNETDSEFHWLAFSVCGRDSNFPKGRINNHAIGSLVEVKTGDYYFATTVKKPRLHFGLGNNQKVDLVRFLWTSGMPQSRVNVESGQSIYEEMFEKGSCPYIYTWDGSKFVFFSDCLWAAPLGLQYAPGKFIPCRNWEYLKIPGEFLKPRDGQYVLQLTEELREAAYFDLIKLYVVDHPEEIEIYTNEKVGPPFIAQHQIHTVRNPLTPKKATDARGNDVLSLIADRDNKYFKGFEEPIAKGLVPMNYLELDLGDLAAKIDSKDPSARVTLFLNGWIRPTDCSLNISYAQNPDEPSPVPPVILVPNEKGEWIKTVDPMGFPGGKPKTIAVDITKAFLCNDYRLRIQTSHEIYWDQVFFTVGENQGEFKQTELNLKSADLHYRGFSKRFTKGNDAPEVYDYQQVNSTPRWPAMTGRFTRFGDVKPLLKIKDDQSVVIGAGDEMTVAFDAIEDPPAGWKRDFVIHLVGYDKDGDLNTVTGQSSEPLPFDEMSSYPYGPDEEFPDTPQHREYLKKYQTRVQRWGSFWRRVTPTDSE